MKLPLIILLLTSSSIYAANITCPAGVTNVTSEQANEIYQQVRAMDNIPYKYVVDGCDVRAYLGAKEVYETKGVTSFRVNFETYPGMYLETPYTVERGVEFNKHSAMALCVNDRPQIIDVAFFDAPVTMREFYDALIDPDFIKSDRVDIYTSSMYGLNPEEKMRRTSFDSASLRCANKIAKRFMREQLRIERGDLPIGVGRAKEVLRVGICD